MFVLEEALSDLLKYDVVFITRDNDDISINIVAANFPKTKLCYTDLKILYDYWLTHDFLGPVVFLARKLNKKPSKYWMEKINNSILKDEL